MGKDTCSTIKDLFNNGKFLGEFNTNFISLIPNVKTHAKVTNYKPVSCCNVVYKGISKVITNRLKFVLSDLVDVNQIAFIPIRQVSDNILLAQEFIMGYHLGNKTTNCTFKVDMQKAYDTVSWEFLELCLREFDF